LRVGGPTVGFTRTAGLVKEFPPQEQLQARVAADVRARQGGRLHAVLGATSRAALRLTNTITRRSQKPNRRSFASNAFSVSQRRGADSLRA